MSAHNILVLNILRPFLAPAKYYARIPSSIFFILGSALPLGSPPLITNAKRYLLFISWRILFRPYNARVSCEHGRRAPAGTDEPVGYRRDFCRETHILD